MGGICMYDLSSCNIGEKINKVRKNRELSLNEFGSKIGKSKATIYKYESGQVMPDFITILEICNVLGLTIVELCELEHIERDNSKAINPFKVDIVYLYYLGNINNKSKLIASTIKVESLGGIKKVTFHNSYKDKNNSYVNEYIGTMESDNAIVFMNLRNDNVTTQKFEKVQIMINLKLSEDNKYMGSINATTESNIPTARKCILSTEKIEDRDELNDVYEKLKITAEEVESIKKNSFWNMKIDYFQDYGLDITE